MRIADLKDKKIVIWGLGREARASAELIRKHLPGQALIFVDENADADISFLARGDRAIFDAAQIAAAIDAADIIIKSPGVSLYHPLLKNKKPTSLLNLWLAEPHAAKTICVTGTKGKSTTSALLAHTLNALGQPAALLGNIGVPVTESTAQQGYAIIEVSSYQAANFSESCDIGVVTSLYPEHLDWHKSLGAYYRDKLNLLNHSGVKIINREAWETARQNGIAIDGAVFFNDPSSFHIRDGKIYDGDTPVGTPPNAHLSRAHNLVNVCAVLAVLRHIGVDAKAALAKMENFHGLPHRQQEIGSQNGVLYIDDSISTTPQSAIAAMEVYADRPVILLAGGFDRGIDYAPLVDYVQHKNIHAVICMGPSGQRIYDGLKSPNAFMATSLQEAVALAQRQAKPGGVILLSPAAPSYGMFKNFEERGQKFAEYTGLPPYKDNN